jgi:alpha-L-fucosidase
MNKISAPRKIRNMRLLITAAAVLLGCSSAMPPRLEAGAPADRPVGRDVRVADVSAAGTDVAREVPAPPLPLDAAPGDAAAPDGPHPPVDAASSPRDSAADAPGVGSRLAWWHQAKLGMFIHWGLYAVPAGQWNGQRIAGSAEWIMNNAMIPVQDYAKLAQSFNPTKFDAQAWVAIAEAAGMKYMVFTAKHHDGFAMYPSQVSRFALGATPWKRDPVRELADAAARRGIKFGVYYSHAVDWHHPGGSDPQPVWDPAQAGGRDDYLRDVSVPQVRELLANYPDLAVLWWDTPRGMTPARSALLDALLPLQPSIITNNRLGGGFRGDFDVAERTIPTTVPARPFESALTINGTWGYRSDDTRWKTAAALVSSLIQVVSKGGNLLLNVGPTGEGVIPAESADRLAQMGAWLKVNGEAIYGAAASPLPDPPWGRVTVKKQRAYLHLLQRPAATTIRVPMRNVPRRIYPLETPATTLVFESLPTGVEVTLPPLPAASPGGLPTVVAIELAEDAVIPAAAPP